MHISVPADWLKQGDPTMHIELLTMVTATVYMGAMLTLGRSVPAVRYRRVGGLRFIRVGRFQASFCVVRGG